MPVTYSSFEIPPPEYATPEVGGPSMSPILLEDIVRIDNDDTGKGIHWNAKNLSDTSKKFAACEERTIKMKENERLSLFYDYLKALENLSADTIWDWWRTGKKPTHVAEVEAEAEAEAQE